MAKLKKEAALGGKGGSILVQVVHASKYLLPPLPPCTITPSLQPYLVWWVWGGGSVGTTAVLPLVYSIGSHFSIAEVPSAAVNFFM